MPAPTIPVRYWCADCGLADVTVNVPEREDAADDIVVWFRQVLTAALVADHKARSPACHPDAFSKVLIPTSGRPLIGGRVEH